MLISNLFCSVTIDVTLQRFYIINPLIFSKLVGIIIASSSIIYNVVYVLQIFAHYPSGKRATKTVKFFTVLILFFSAFIS